MAPPGKRFEDVNLATRTHRLLLITALSLLAMSQTVAGPLPSADALEAIAPRANRAAITLALSAVYCAQAHGQGTTATRLTLIDYSLSSLTPRLWVFDLTKQRLLFEEHVAHGQGSGDNFANAFSNNEGSHQTSLGLFLTRGTYHGANGYSLRLDGLDPGLNDRAMDRAIVIHGAPYVDPISAKARGRLGRSWGCPALRTSVAADVIDTIKNGNFVFSYYPDKALVASAQLARCANAQRLAQNAGGPAREARAAP